MKIDNNKLIKNYLSEALIKNMYENCFHKNSNRIIIKELHGGMKNTVYLINDDNTSVVLKVAPKNSFNMISADKNNMWWEAKMLKLMEKLDIPAPKLILFDESYKICSEPYIFMSYIPGKVYSDIKYKLSFEEKCCIEYQIGKISKKISSIKGKHYFLPSLPNEKFKNNFEFIYELFDMLITDMRNNNISFDNEVIDIIYDILLKNKDYLNNVKDISLCNSDLWDGNILIDDGKISGIVDFADLYFCDELMTFYFHTIDGFANEKFLQGFNKIILSYDENIRIEIYRLYVIFKMIVDCELKNYGKFDWMYQNLENQINKLKN